MAEVRPRSLALLAGLSVILATASASLALDLDRDGLSSWAELGAGTSPWHGDTDGDELADGFEIDRELDALAPDTDADDVDDRRELADGTDPRTPDSDADGLDDGRERDLRTNPRTSDTDDDTVSDAREVDVGIDPRASDTEADGLDDATELLRGASPWVADTDDDGWDDVREAEGGPEDCDGDGIDRIAEADDDDDGLADPDEDEAWRCQRDTDADGIRDGDEAARACVQLPDCDVDGLADDEELDTEFDRLDPDTFDAGVLDGVSKAFQTAGQPPSRDGDLDGIPDAWEDAEGLIRWTRFDPRPGQRDLLVEFVRVEGPDSSRFGPGPMASAYDRVERFFEDGGDVEMAWIETTVRLEEEPRPPLIPSGREDYYREVLEQAASSDNPYVTTVVVNPQHDQQRVQHLGVAPIRGMLAAVDYGAHTQVSFEGERSSLRMSPYVESLVAADRIDLLGRSGITDGGTTEDGRMFLQHADWRLSWRPLWFAEPPVRTLDDGTRIQHERTGTNLDRAELADTIAHELGHTLGLCHTNLPDCRANLSAADREVIGVSTMDERRTGNELAFLDSEWDRLHTYLACPPQRPLALLADGAERSTIVDAKYEITLENVLDVGARECRGLDPVASDLTQAAFSRTYEPPYTFSQAEAQASPTGYEPEADDRVPTARIHGAGGALAYAAASLLAALGVGLGLAGWKT